MEFADLVGFIRTDLSDNLFQEMRSCLYDHCVPFYLVKEKQITPDLLAEKLCDYFVKVQFNTGRTLDQQIAEYTSTIDEIISDGIMKYRDHEKKGNVSSTSRAWKYYEKACDIRKGCSEKQKLIDYSRIMLCLYMALQRNERKPISNFDFSSSSLDISLLLSSLQEETFNFSDVPAEAGKHLIKNVISFLSPVEIKQKNDTRTLKSFHRNKRFQTNQPYEKETCTFVILIVMYYMIKAETDGGENDD